MPKHPPTNPSTLDFTSLAVGFDLRIHRTPVVLLDEDRLTVHYDTNHGPATLTAHRDIIEAALLDAGYIIYTPAEPYCPYCHTPGHTADDCPEHDPEDKE